jgi:hypothetical protein
VAQSVDGDETTFAWDWVAGLPELLAATESTNPDPMLYLVGHETLARWDGSAWAYHLSDALGSVRQTADGAGAVTESREWAPYGVEVGTAHAGLGYTGGWCHLRSADRSRKCLVAEYVVWAGSGDRCGGP